jgi:hypothetical protein
VAQGVRTARLFHGETGAPDFHSLYTCPAGTTTIVKDLRAAANGTSAGKMQIGVKSGPATVWLHQELDAASDQRVSLTPWVVLEPGDQLMVLATVANGWALHISGTELDGVAPDKGTVKPA